jgi:hypothetical protein
MDEEKRGPVTDTVLEVQDGVIEINFLFRHIDKGLGIINENTEVKGNGEIS